MLKALLIIGAIVFALPASARTADRGTILPHPSGCPRVAFCGCGVSVRIFGHPVRELYRAAAYLSFPSTIAAAGAVAVFGRHHVAYIEAMVGTDAILYDPNSGGHLTRRHLASLAGAKIVAPNTWTTSTSSHTKSAANRRSISRSVAHARSASRSIAMTETPITVPRATVLDFGG